MNNIYQQLQIKDGVRHTALSKEEGEYLYRFIKEHQCRKTLEIGFGFGVSAVYIMSATQRIHYAIDPFVDSRIYENLGIKNISKFGLRKNLKHTKNFSHNVLPKLLGKKMLFDFVLIDGGHKFDEKFVDFYFTDLLLEKNGFVLLHDAWSPQVKTMVNWIKSNKNNYKLLESELDGFVICQKNGDDKRKWYDFEKFEVSDKGNISRYH